ncbi:MAG: CHAD domain-containing protein [Tepidisphaeraceae bacterium]|jgi:CHAD domain-containing protein
MSKRNEDFPLLKYVDSLVESLRKLIPSAVTGEDDDAVHDARVATRRLKAASDLVKGVVSGRSRRPFNRVGKLLRRQLGPLRDLDVMLEHLGQFKQPKYQPAIQWVRERLGELRQEAVRRAGRNAPPARMLARLGTWWGLRHEIEIAHDSIGQLLSQSVHLQLDAFVEQADDLVGDRPSDPHPLRIAGKSLRYTLEMARQHGNRLPRSVVSLFKRMQTALGLWHDYVVLAERIMRESVECDLALHNPRLQVELLGVVQFCLRRSESQLKKMAGLWKTRGQPLTQTIRQAFPLTEHVEAPAEAVPAVAESGAAPAA